MNPSEAKNLKKTEVLLSDLWLSFLYEQDSLLRFIGHLHSIAFGRTGHQRILEYFVAPIVHGFIKRRELILKLLKVDGFSSLYYAYPRAQYPLFSSIDEVAKVVFGMYVESMDAIRISLRRIKVNDIDNRNFYLWRCARIASHIGREVEEFFQEKNVFKNDSFQEFNRKTLRIKRSFGGFCNYVKGVITEFFNSHKSESSLHEPSNYATQILLAQKLVGNEIKFVKSIYGRSVQFASENKKTMEKSFETTDKSSEKDELDFENFIVSIHTKSNTSAAAHALARGPAINFADSDDPAEPMQSDDEAVITFAEQIPPDDIHRFISAFTDKLKELDSGAQVEVITEMEAS